MDSMREKVEYGELPISGGWSEVELYVKEEMCTWIKENKLGIIDVSGKQPKRRKTIYRNRWKIRSSNYWGSKRRWLYRFVVEGKSREYLAVHPANSPSPIAIFPLAADSQLITYFPLDRGDQAHPNNISLIFVYNNYISIEEREDIYKIPYADQMSLPSNFISSSYLQDNTELYIRSQFFHLHGSTLLAAYTTHSRILFYLLPHQGHEIQYICSIHTQTHSSHADLFQILDTDILLFGLGEVGEVGGVGELSHGGSYLTLYLIQPTHTPLTYQYREKLEEGYTLDHLKFQVLTSRNLNTHYLFTLMHDDQVYYIYIYIYRTSIKCIVWR